MNRYVKMLVFALVMGIFTSALLVSVDLLTADRIEANQQANLYMAILDNNDIEYTQADLADIFEQEIEVIEEDGLTFYIHPESGSVSYRIEGGGVWGPIIGIVTLESDFETIKGIAILDQEETPGLGGVIENPEYRAKYVGKSMVPELIISRDADMDDPNQVDAIVGGTRTSNNFEDIMNNEFQRHREVFETLDLDGVIS